MIAVFILINADVVLGTVFSVSTNVVADSESSAHFEIHFQIVAQSTLCDPIDGSPPSSLVLGNLQARTLEWVAISFSNA